MIFDLARKFRDYRAQRLIASHLARLDDHELNDIGIARQDIDLVVRRGRLQL